MKLRAWIDRNGTFTIGITTRNSAPVDVPHLPKVERLRFEERLAGVVERDEPDLTEQVEADPRR